MIDEREQRQSEAISTSNEQNIIEPKVDPNVQKLNVMHMTLRSLKQLQSETRAIEVEFFEHVYGLETDFQKKHELVYQKWCAIVNGDYVPNETGRQSGDEKKKQINLSEAGVETHTKSGLAHFWLTVLSLTLPDIHENDRPILEHLTDVRVQCKPLSDLGFILEFHFSPNEYFENGVLSKEYYYMYDVR